MLEEVNPRKSRGWVPHSTFASEMGMASKGAGNTSAEETEVEKVIPVETAHETV